MTQYVNDHILANAKRALFNRGRRGEPMAPPYSKTGPGGLFSRAAEEVLTHRFGPDWAILVEPFYERGLAGEELGLCGWDTESRRMERHAHAIRYQRWLAARREYFLRQKLGTQRTPPATNPREKAMRPELVETMPWDDWEEIEDDHEDEDEYGVVS